MNFKSHFFLLTFDKSGISQDAVSPLTLATKPNGKEVSVFAGSAWKTAFTKMLNAGRSEKGLLTYITLNRI